MNYGRYIQKIGRMIFFAAICVILMNSIQAGENILARLAIKWRILIADGAGTSLRKTDNRS
jgi:hypothetical protein